MQFRINFLKLKLYTDLISFVVSKTIICMMRMSCTLPIKSFFYYLHEGEFPSFPYRQFN